MFKDKAFEHSSIYILNTHVSYDGEDQQVDELVGMTMKFKESLKTSNNKLKQDM